MSQDAAATVEVLLFEVGGTRYGVDASEVAQVGRAPTAGTAALSLGTPRQGHKALFFHDSAGAPQSLIIDGVLGVKTVPVASLRRLPASTGAHPASIGAWLDGQDAVLLIDLQMLLETTGSMPKR